MVGRPVHKCLLARVCRKGKQDTMAAATVQCPVKAEEEDALAKAWPTENDIPPSIQDVMSVTTFMAFLEKNWTADMGPRPATLCVGAGSTGEGTVIACYNYPLAGDKIFRIYTSTSIKDYFKNNPHCKPFTLRFEEIETQKGTFFKMATNTPSPELLAALPNNINTVLEHWEDGKRIYLDNVDNPRSTLGNNNNWNKRMPSNDLYSSKAAKGSQRHAHILKCITMHAHTSHKSFDSHPQSWKQPSSRLFLAKGKDPHPVRRKKNGTRKSCKRKDSRNKVPITWPLTTPSCCTRISLARMPAWTKMPTLQVWPPSPKSCILSSPPTYKGWRRKTLTPSWS